MKIGDLVIIAERPWSVFAGQGVFVTKIDDDGIGFDFAIPEQRGHATSRMVFKTLGNFDLTKVGIKAFLGEYCTDCVFEDGVLHVCPKHPFLQPEFCRYCGAGMGRFRKEDEGTCEKCDPEGVKAWVARRNSQGWLQVKGSEKELDKI